MVPRISNARRLLPVSLLLILWPLATASAGVYRPQHKMAVALIQRLEAEWQTAQLHGDVSAMDRLLSDDFLGITAAGTVVTKAQELERIRTRRFMLSAVDVDDVRIKLIGKIAIVTSLARVEGSSEGEAVAGSYRYTRIYQRVGGDNWKITSFEATRVPLRNDIAFGRSHHPTP